MKKSIRSISTVLALCVGSMSIAWGDQAADIQKTYAEIEAAWGFVPEFIRVMPAQAVSGVWEAHRGLYSPTSAIPKKYKSLISLGVAAQIPCRSCVYMTTEFLKADGATPQELQEAVGVAAIVRNLSSFLNGIQLDEGLFRSETDSVIGFVRARMNPQPPEVPVVQPPVEIRTVEEAYADIRLTLGILPTFLKEYPAEGIVGTWKEMKGLQLGQTSVPNKYKELLGLAVASQVPCRYCTYFHTETAKLNGASDQEVREAAAVAGLSFHMATYLNGSNLDEAMFRSEIDRIVKFMHPVVPPEQTKRVRLQ